MGKSHTLAALAAATILFVAPVALWATGTVETTEDLPTDGTVPLGVGRRETFPAPDPTVAGRLTDYIGAEIRDYNDNRIGTVADFAVDLSASYAPYLVASIGDSKIPVPVTLFRTVPGSQPTVFYIDVEERVRLEQAPTMADINPSRAVSDVVWDNRVHRYWAYSGIQAPPIAFQGGYRRYRFVGPGGGMRVLMGAVATSNELMGHEIVSVNGAPVADVSDIVLDLPTAETPYLILTTDWGTRLVPMEAFTLVGTEDTIRLEGPDAILRRAPVLSMGEGSRYRGEDWDEEVAKYWRSSDILVAVKPGMRVLPGLLVRAGRTDGIDIINTYGASVGRITDYLITRDGDIPYALIDSYLSNAGENRRYPVPLPAFTIERKKAYAVTGLGRREAARLPALPPDGLEDLSWEGPTVTFWSSTYDLTFEARGERLYSLAELTGTRVVGTGGAYLGTAADALLNIGDGEVAFAVVRTNDGRRVPVPFRLVSIQDEAIRVRASRRSMDEAPAMDDRLRLREAADAARYYWADFGS